MRDRVLRHLALAALVACGDGKQPAVGPGTPCDVEGSLPACSADERCIGVGEDRFVCTNQCSANTDCVAGWTCSTSPLETAYCTCSAAPEICDGLDNDCDGTIDDEPAADQSCPTGARCQAGHCVCANGGVGCGDTCVVLTTAENCGACGNVCPTGATCAAGECQCPPGEIACDGVCTNTATDNANCGLCGNECPAPYQCADSVCPGCPTIPGDVLCFATCADLQADTSNCGSCGNECPPGAACQAGTCACLDGTGDCDGVCRALMKDTSNCGACGNACLLGGLCLNGQCECPLHQSACQTFCSDLNQDPANCGTCGNACETGQICSGGTCACPAGGLFCNGVCIDPAADPANCGGCGQTCASDLLCVGGHCTCTADVDNDARNCGGCNVICPPAFDCVEGQCACADGLFACSGTCSTSACGECPQECPTAGSGASVCAGNECANLVALATDLEPPQSLVVAGGEVFWNDTATVSEVPVGGGIVRSFGADALPASPQAVAAGGANVYVVGEDYPAEPTQSLVRISQSGADAQLLASGHSIVAIAADDAGVYWIEPPTVLFVSAARSDVTVLGSVQGVMATPLASSSAGVLCVVSAGTSFAVELIPAQGGSPTTLVNLPTAPTALAADAMHVYIAAGQQLLTAGIAGGEVVTLASGVSALSLAVNATSIFGLDGAVGRLWQVPIVGGPVVTLIDEPDSTLQGLSIDAASVYWLDTDHFLVMKLTPD